MLAFFVCRESPERSGEAFDVKSLVTGGTGFIGANVVRALVDAGDDVRVLVRASSDRSNLDGLGVALAEGDLGDRDSLQAAMDGCSRVFHIAALYSFWVRDPDALFEANVEGTRNVLEAAAAAHVDRIVYTSSVAALAAPHAAAKPVTEETPIDISRIIGAYKRSKYLAEQVALEHVERGAPVVIVNPSFPVGPYDIKPTPSGRLILDFLNRRMPAYVRTGLNVVDVEDVARGHLLAAERGRVGERYILGGENLSMRAILQLLSEITGLPSPRVRLPYRPVLALSYVNAGWARMAKRTPRMTPDTIRMTRHPMYYDPGKAIEELGFPRTSARVALEKAVRWFTESGYVTRRVSRAAGSDSR